MPPRKTLAPPPAPEPVEPAPNNDGPNWYTRIIGPGSQGTDVAVVQGKLGITVNSVFDADTEKALDNWLTAKSMEPIGMVDLDVANALGNAAVKSWWYRRLYLRGPFLLEGDDVSHVQQRLGLPVSGRYCNETAKRVKGWQTAYGLKPTGDVDQSTAERFSSVGT